MTRLVLIMILLASLFSCQKNDSQTGWVIVPEIIRQISLPAFPDRDYILTDFGAVGDSVTDCHEAFKNAINRCNQEGGGRVVVPAGIYLINGRLVHK